MKTTNCKVLLCGPVDGQWELVNSKLTALQSSAQGPFDVVFIVGQAFKDEHDFKQALQLTLPLPVYFFDPRGVPRGAHLPANLSLIDACKPLSAVTVAGLQLVYFNTAMEVGQEETAALAENCSRTDYRGCDLLFTSAWPSGYQQYVEDYRAPSSSAPSASSVVTALALQARPRYHIASGSDIFYQRPPYSTPGAPCCRLVCLSGVNSSGEKSRKWLYALSLAPLARVSDAELGEVPPGCTPCPYLSDRLPSGKQPLTSQATGDLKRARTEPPYLPALPPPRPGRFSGPEDAAAQKSGTFFFGQLGTGRPHAGQAPPTSALQTAPPSDLARTLFVGGLPRGMREADLAMVLPNALRIHHTEGKGFAFADFASHAAAAAVLAASQKSPLLLGGRALSLGWGKQRQGTGAGGESGTSGTSLQLEPPSTDAVTLYVGGLPPAYLQEEVAALLPGSARVRPVLGRAYCFVDMKDHSAATSAVALARTSPLLLRGCTLAVGWAQHSRCGTENTPTEDARTLFVGHLPPELTSAEVIALLCPAAGTAPAPSVHKPAGKDYAFAEFRSHSLAAAALAAFRPTRSAEEGEGEGAALMSPTVSWARGRPADSQSGAGMEDCWFCLASPTLKAHLLLSVGQHAYLALPRGAVCTGHVLVVPIECVPSRLLLSSEAKKEVNRYEAAVRSCYSSTAGGGQTGLLFERTLRTRGRDHVQVQLVPLPPRPPAAEQYLEIFLRLAVRQGIPFTELEDELEEALLGSAATPLSDSSQAVVTALPAEGPAQEYFYIEVPASSGGGRTCRRFLYVPPAGAAAEGSRLSMSFGLEVAAECLGRPERAHWKQCVVSEAEEARAAESFKSLFSPFDFTIEEE
ncbi:unnamed protein product [Sphagnum jensenii]|uniref:RRM domain-containing protein n=1 Tax=Sphagnum jensenii TaxID=128206 RepID=A0ABP0VGM5_9BRYO